MRSAGRVRRFGCGCPRANSGPRPGRPTPAGGGASVTVGVAHDGTDVGEIEVHVDPAQTSAFDRRLLNDLAGPAGIALSTVRLTRDLRRRRSELAALAEALAASRDRLLTARRDEQRRLRGEVQDRVVSHIESALALVDRGDLPAPPAIACRCTGRAPADRSWHLPAAARRRRLRRRGRRVARASRPLRGASRLTRHRP